MFKKVLIANRGEIALRIIRACREMKIATVAVYSEADANSLHVRFADEAVCIGAPPNRDSYLNMPNIISAAVITGSDAIHPGYGYFSEQPNFAEACEACNLTFIGPKPSAMEQMGDKAKARETMQKAGVPVIPGTKGSVESEKEAFRVAKKISYPLRVKASAGGGGRGQRVVHNEEDLAAALKMAQAEAESAFGSPDIYIEKEVEDPRHIEIQILADSKGHVVHLGERDCSVQTARYQKMIEEAPSVGLTPHLRAKIGEAAVKAARAVGYTNAGTVEFLLDKDGGFYFMEMNTRVQVEHCITEMVSGVDIVKTGIRVAAGEGLPLRQEEIELVGHAIEFRINAEDPADNFMPSPGVVTQWIPPGGPWVRLDSHVYQGYMVPPFYDSLLGKLIVWGRDREECLARSRWALDQFLVDGVKTVIPFHRLVLDHPLFMEGDVNTHFIEDHLD